MPDELEVRGVVAEIRWAYHLAGRLQGYTMTVHKKTGTGTIDGALIEADAFRLAQQPLELVALGIGRWGLRDVRVGDGRLRATVSRQQEGG